LTRVKRRAASADLVIVNHALFFADLAAGSHASGSIVPHHTAVIFDEAHGLEEVATSHWGVSVSYYRVRDLLADLRREPLPEHEASGRATLSEAADRVQAVAERAFDALRIFVGPDAVRVGWAPDGADRAAAAGLDLLARLADVKQGIDALGARGEGWARLAERVGALARDARFLWRAEDPSYVFWVETSGAAVRLSASPLDVSSILRDALFSSGMPCILTSATLTAGGSFGYLKNRLGIDDAEELALASPFDYQTQALVYVPREFPLPRDPLFIDAVTDEVVRIVSASRGRAFVLFTSHRALDRVFEGCRQRLDYPVLKQGDGPRMALIERFKAAPSVLFATMGFWQGIDVPGEALSCVVLDKLPFAPPDDPIVQARTDALKNEGIDPFAAYQLPAAAIWLKQGFGRLVRSRRDRGVIAILDRRLLTHGYGRFFFDSLPPAPLTSSLMDVQRFFAVDNTRG
jgi:ATP-dependent DNA helicase DinG